MITEETKDQIAEKARLVNSASEKYQLIHATFAIEKMFKDKMQKEYADGFEAVRMQLWNEEDEEKRKVLYQKARELRNESNKKIKILVNYIPQIKDNSARTTKTQGNTFMITLPECLGNIRNEEGKIDFDKLKRLRKLMAHELGHIVLHSGTMDISEVKMDAILEEEAEFFADSLINMRKERNEEIYQNGNYKNI